MCVCVYDILYVLYVKKKLYLVAWHAPSKTRCSGGLSYIILAHVVCQLVRRPPSSYAVPIVRDIRTPLIIAVWAHTTAPLTICFVPTISVLIYFIGSIIIYYFGFTGDDATRDSRSMEKKNIKTTAVGTTQATTSRWPLFRVFPKYKTSLYTYSATLRLFVDVCFTNTQKIYYER